MSNPVGWALSLDNYWPGLTATTSFRAADNTATFYAGSWDAGIGGTYYARPFGIPVPTGPYYSDVNPDPGSGDSYIETRQMNGSFDGSITSTMAAAAAAAEAADFVTIQLIGISSGIGGGWVHFSESDDPAYYTNEDITMAGIGALDSLVNGPRFRASGDPINKLTLPNVAGVGAPVLTSNGRPGTWTLDRLAISGAGGGAFLLRPTAHTWPGQDPDLLTNRAFWTPSEVGEITYRMAGYAESAAFRAVFEVDRYVLQTFPTLVPPPAPPLPPARPPGTLILGPLQGGVVRGGIGRGIQTRRLTGSGLSFPGAGSSAPLSIADLVHLARAYSFSDPPMAAAIAMAESGGDPSQIAHNAGPPPSDDRGLWQINSVYHAEVSDACAYDPVCAAQAAYVISNGGSDWTPWSTFGNGAYLQFIDAARAVP